MYTRLLLLAALSGLSGCALVELSRLDASYPLQSGGLPAAGLQQMAVVIRDDLGVPHVDAQSEDDAWYGLGFVHGQDRLFQADLLRHLAHGRISEWLGESSVELDAFVRAMELNRLAEENVAALNPGSRAMLEAYAAGLNAGAASLPELPIEYRLLGVPFEPWSAADCLSTTFLQSWNLSTNARFELTAWSLRGRDDSAELLDILFRLEESIPPMDAYWQALAQVRTGDFTPGFLAFTDALGGRADSAQASNNWAVGGDRTRSGLPIVANNPHLSQSVPSLWYMADVRGGGLHVAGATLPGTPGVVIGHNGHVAWGMTNLMADVVDFAVLKRDGESHYILGGERLPLEAVQVEIAVKDGQSQTRTLYRTAAGPAVTGPGGGHLLAMRWHALELEDKSPQVLRALNHARSADEAAAIASMPTMAALAIALGDTGGGWGWQAYGAVPQRRGYSGRVPYPAWDPAYGWDGFMTALPGERAPERGYVHTANARPEVDAAWDGQGPVDVSAITSAWAPPHRHGRIAELLAEVDDATPAEMHRLQLDRIDVTARDKLPYLLGGTTRSHAREGRVCFDLLDGWDYSADADAAAPAVWAVFQRALLREALVDELGADGVALYLQTASPGRSLFHGDQRNLDRVLENRPVQAARALDATCRELSETLGRDAGQWRWGALHPLALRHPFGRSRLLDGWNMEPLEWSGSSTTVAASGYSWSADTMKVGGMVSLRIVMPLADLAASTVTHPGGQSGQPGHADYRSHYAAFAAEDRLPLLYDPEDVLARSRDALILVPDPAGFEEFR